MKKLILATVVAAGALLMASCTSKAEKSEKDLAAKIENCTNTDSIKVYVDQAKAYAQKLVSEGKVDEAKKYLEQIEPVVKAKAPQLAGALSTAETALDKVKEAAGDAADNVKAAGDSAAVAAGEAVDKAKDAASTAVENAKDEAAAKVSDAAQKASDKVSDAAQQAKDKASEKVNDLLKKK